MLKTTESDAELKGLDVDSVVIEHKAPKTQPRTNRVLGDEPLGEPPLPH